MPSSTLYAVATNIGTMDSSGGSGLYANCWNDESDSSYAFSNYPDELYAETPWDDLPPQAVQVVTVTEFLRCYWPSGGGTYSIRWTYNAGTQTAVYSGSHSGYEDKTQALSVAGDGTAWTVAKVNSTTAGGSVDGWSSGTAQVRFTKVRLTVEWRANAAAVALFVSGRLLPLLLPALGALRSFDVPRVAAALADASRRVATRRARAGQRVGGSHRLLINDPEEAEALMTAYRLSARRTFA